eukprot:4345857-Amphidinium_carterae.1
MALRTATCNLVILQIAPVEMPPTSLPYRPMGSRALTMTLACRLPAMPPEQSPCAKTLCMASSGHTT